MSLSQNTNVRTFDEDDGNNPKTPNKVETKVAAKCVFNLHKDFRDILGVD